MRGGDGGHGGHSGGDARGQVLAGGAGGMEVVVQQSAQGGTGLGDWVGGGESPGAAWLAVPDCLAGPCV